MLRTTQAVSRPACRGITRPPIAATPAHRATSYSSRASSPSRTRHPRISDRALIARPSGRSTTHERTRRAWSVSVRSFDGTPGGRGRSAKWTRRRPAPDVNQRRGRRRCLRRQELQQEAPAAQRSTVSTARSAPPDDRGPQRGGVRPPRPRPDAAPERVAIETERALEACSRRSATRSTRTIAIPVPLYPGPAAMIATRPRRESALDVRGPASRHPWAASERLRLDGARCLAAVEQRATRRRPGSRSTSGASGEASLRPPRPLRVAFRDRGRDATRDRCGLMSARRMPRWASPVAPRHCRRVENPCTSEHSVVAAESTSRRSARRGTIVDAHRRGIARSSAAR